MIGLTSYAMLLVCCLTGSFSGELDRPGLTMHAWSFEEHAEQRTRKSCFPIPGWCGCVVMQAPSPCCCQKLWSSTSPSVFP